MIPDYQTLMLPLLELLSDKKEHELQDLIKILSDKFNLTEEERNELLPSGNQEIINNRVGWARTYLKKANLLTSPRRATFKITDQGLEVLKKKPTKIDVKFLQGLDDFKRWQTSYQTNYQNKKDNLINEESITEIEQGRTPEELLDYSFQKLKEELALELIDKIKNCSPAFFERLVIDLLIKMGYGGSKKEAGQVIGKSGDGGIDGIIKEDRLGLDTIYIQAKKWENTVPVAQVRDFAGSLLSKKAKKGIFISTSNYPKGAYDFVDSIEPKIVLIDGKELAELMIQHNVGMATRSFYEIKKLDLDYFEEA
ncbi:MAG: restriction endonuclease [Sediminibacterium sp.]|uniref:restriction endonuclease n=1 Tax=Sediminibacterium sp. TaxID=1917865 RepID=UPI002AB948BB|nr:restriction endonuclease [Sediminibacterium sp.]MDZ4070304.1 restriction endonuclease [Sediminibacterium sp.]